MAEVLLTSLRLASMADGAGPYGILDNAAIAMADAKIQWVGSADNIPASCKTHMHKDCGGRLVTPGLIDCHTHIVFGGNRAREFEMRLEGASYEEIARAGGGIVSTVSATRGASESDLLEQALPRVDALLAEGVCTLEIKSGYGLDTETELRMLRVARKIGTVRNVVVKTSFLGAHAVPAEFKGRSAAYINEI